MSWTYSGAPGSSDLDQVRFYVQDTDPARQLLTNEEISFLIAQWSDAVNSPLYVAAVAAEVIAAKFVPEVNVSGDGISVDQGSLQQRYNDLASSLRDQYKALYQNQGPDLSTILLDEFPDTTIKPLSFGVGMHDNVWAGQQNYGGEKFPVYPGLLDGPA